MSKYLQTIFAAAAVTGTVALGIAGFVRTIDLKVNGSHMGEEFLKARDYTKIIDLNRPKQGLLRLCRKGYEPRAYYAQKGEEPPSNVTVCVGRKSYIIEK